MAVKWGIMGTANIASKVARAITRAENAELVAVASRSMDKASTWGKEYNVPAFYGSYQELLDDPGIDAVYIPLPPSMHPEWTIKAAENGKHVLSEKPLSSTVEEAQAMIDACRKNNVQLMDGVMWVHHDRVGVIQKEIENGTIGDVRRATASFAFNWGNTIPTQNIRARAELGGGALGDLGYYCVRAILFALGAVPQQVFARALYANGVDIEMSGMLLFADNRTASMDCGFTMKGRGWLEIAGSEAALSVDDFVLPGSEDRSSYRIGRSFGERDVRFIGPCIQEVKMIERFSSVVASGTIDENLMQDALNTVKTCSALARSAKSGRVELVE